MTPKPTADTISAATVATAPPGRKPGAQPGNLNAATHLLRSKKIVRDRRDRFQRASEGEAREILAACGLANDPLARLIARQLTRLEAAASRTEDQLKRRGWFDRVGQTKPAATAHLSIVKDLLGQARQLLDELKATGAGDDDETIYSVRLHDGRALHEPAQDASGDADVPEVASANDRDAATTKARGEVQS